MFCLTFLLKLYGIAYWFCSFIGEDNPGLFTGLSNSLLRYIVLLDWGSSSTSVITWNGCTLALTDGGIIGGSIGVLLGWLNLDSTWFGGLVGLIGWTICWGTNLMSETGSWLLSVLSIEFFLSGPAIFNSSSFSASNVHFFLANEPGKTFSLNLSI